MLAGYTIQIHFPVYEKMPMDRKLELKIGGMVYIYVGVCLSVVIFSLTYIFRTTIDKDFFDTSIPIYHPKIALGEWYCDLFVNCMFKRFC